MKVIELEIPFPPSVNRLYKPKRFGSGIYKTEEAKRYTQTVFALTYNKGKLSAPLAIEMWIVAHPPKLKRKRDLDNLLKITLDSLQGQVFDNDSQIGRLHIEWGPVDKAGYLEIRIEELVV
jgi:crossover junction endodeoxyribonuclease RusA